MIISNFPIIPVKVRKEEHLSFAKISSEMGRSILFLTGTTGFPYKWRVP